MSKVFYNTYSNAKMKFKAVAVDHCRKDSHRCDSMKEEDIPCDLKFENLTTAPLPNNPFMLDDVSGVVKPGELLAVMGPTGCGKTTFLSTLVGIVPVASGSVKLNGENISKRLRRKKIGYVQQSDVFFSDLTLNQTLEYQALLRLPDKKFTKAEKLEKADEIIDALDLRRCHETIIGNEMKRGLSGGERKRLSIACELITNPHILLIDEPTSGLDASFAAELMEMLKTYAMKESKCVVVAIHQPSSKIFHLFDRLLLLNHGKTAYFGYSSDVIQYFSSLGLNIAPNYNPADFVVEQVKNESEKLITAWSQKNSISVEISSAKADLSDQFIHDTDVFKKSTEFVNSSWPTSFCTQIRVLAKRNFIEAKQRMLSKFNWIQTLALALMSGLVWFRTERTEEALPDLEGWMFFASNYWMLFSLFGALPSFPAERAVVEKERLSGAYRLSSYYIAKMIGEAPLVMVLPSIYFMISYPMLGGTIVSFTGILFIQILASLAAQSAGLFFGAACDPSASITVAALFTLLAQLLGGYLANNIPSYFKTVSLVYHAFRNMQILEYHFGADIACSKHLSSSKFQSCYQANATASTGSLFINRYELLQQEDEFSMPYWTHTAFLLAFLFIFRLLGYLALRRSL